MFFTPRHIKEGKHYRHALKRLIHYKKDILSSKDLAILDELLAKLQKALRSRKRDQIDSVRDEIDRAVGKIAPPARDAGWRENVEVFLVAIVIAAGVRAYFLQPFKIPTGSMQPTLFGIVGTSTETAPPNLLARIFQLVWLGRNYIDVTASEDETILDLREATYLNFFTFTTIVAEKSRYTVFAPRDTLFRDFGVQPRRIYHQGEKIARGFIETGDQVFVDKMSFHFTSPRRGDVFVFKTTGIRRIEIGLPPGVESQHYIKRLAGLPGDVLRIGAPYLFVNGKIPSEWVFQRVMSGLNGYRGYSNMYQFPYLSTPAETYTVPEHGYFALGDNSYFSKDSRDFGAVPDLNVTGKGLLVYWPFSRRWGLIH
ncbi:MAG TPA: signal peptidase I [Terrimicrobiaceae bacterium]|nr:signal peptidase I [Terrimicrobiaceae bacterium]